MSGPVISHRRYGVGRLLNLSVLAVALALVIAAVACGSSSSSDEPVESQPTAAAPANTPTSEPVVEATPEPAEPAAPETRSVGEVEGVTFAVGEGSKATFKVREELASVPLPFDAEVSTTALSGEVHMDGRDSVIEINLQQLSSDNSFRDRYIRSRMFGEHPTGVVTVKGVNDLPSGFASGETITRQVDAELLIREVTVPLTFDVEARDEGDVVTIVGRTTFTWDDLQMTKPSARSVISLDDEVKVEVQLSVTPAE